MRTFFTSKKVSDSLYIIWESYCDTQSLTLGLAVGSERAVLIDCGLGAVDGLRKYAESLTDKPVFCIATHGHPDHAGAAGLFEFIYMNEKDIPEIRWGLTRERRLSDLQDFSNHNEEVQRYAETHCVDNTEVHFKSIQTGDIFDLGGVQLEILEIPGHTKGSVAVINREEKYIFSGDAVSRTLMVTGYERSCMEESYAALKRLVDIGETMLPNLTLYAAHYPQPVPLQMAADLRDACHEVLLGERDADERTHFKFAEMNDPDIVLYKHCSHDVEVTYNAAAFR